MGESRPRMKATNKRMDGAQMGVASGWVDLSLRRIVGFGGRVCGLVNGLCHGLTDGNGWTARKWKSLRAGWACPCGGFWVSAGVSVGESRPRILSANKRMDDVQMAVASEWAGLSLRRIMGFGGRVRGGKSSTNEKPRIHEWTMCKWEWFQTGWACPCGGFWVLAGVAVGLDG